MKVFEAQLPVEGFVFVVEVVVVTAVVDVAVVAVARRKCLGLGHLGFYCTVVEFSALVQPFCRLGKKL